MENRLTPLSVIPPALMLASCSGLFCIAGFGITYVDLGRGALLIASLFSLGANYGFYLSPHEDNSLEPEVVGLLEQWIAPHFAVIILLTTAYAVACALPDEDRRTLATNILCAGGVALLLNALLLWVWWRLEEDCP